MLQTEEITEKINYSQNHNSSDGKPKAQVSFQPTLFVYLGTSSGQIAYRVKKLLKEAYGDVPVLRHLWVDIDTDIVPLARPWFSASERAELSGFNPATVIQNIENYPTIKDWWPDKTSLKAGMLAGGGSPQQMRLIGRMALFRKYNDQNRGSSFINRLQDATEALFEIENIKATQNKSSNNIKYSVDQGCRVVIVHSTSGGTGSAISFDVAYLCRNLLKGKNPTVISISVLPPVIDKAMQSETQGQKDKVRANTYAWFKENNHLTNNPFWNVQYPEGAPVEIVAPPFDYRFVVDIENQANYRLNSTDDVYNMIAQAVFLDTGSSIAGAIRGFTANVTALGESFEGMRCSFSSLAAASLIYPKERILNYCANRQGSSLITNGLLSEADEHQAKVDVSTLISNLRLNDADMLSDMLSETQFKMHYGPAIQKAKSVAAAILQINTQESENQISRQAASKKLDESGPKHLVTLKKSLSQELTRLAALKGFVFAQSVATKLLAQAPSGEVEINSISFDSFKTRIIQSGFNDSDLQEAKKDYEDARTALKKLDDGPEDILERAINKSGWNKKFEMYKGNVISVMEKINEISIQLTALRNAISIYDQLASESNNIASSVGSAVHNAKNIASELLIEAERLGSRAESKINRYEFLQEIDVDFSDYYHKHVSQIDTKNIFSGMIPAYAMENIDTLINWTSENIKTATVNYARQFFIEDLQKTSLLSMLKALAENQNIDPQSFIKAKLDRLVEYCHPFWQYDKDRGLSDLEGKSILGVEDENSLLIPEEYRNGSLYEIKTTGFRDRIDVVRIKHGLPAFLIRGMDDYRTVYEKKRKGIDPLHVLPGMEFARELMPKRGQQGRDLFAIGLAFGYIIQVVNWYYLDHERGLAKYSIQPGREFRLDQGREKSEDVFSRKEEWQKMVEEAIEAEVRRLGNTAAINKLDEAIKAHRSKISKMPSGDDVMRKQFEREIEAIKAMQRRLGKIG